MTDLFQSGTHKTMMVMRNMIFMVMLEEIRKTASGMPATKLKVDLIEQMISECEELAKISNDARTFTRKYDSRGQRIRILDVVKYASILEVGIGIRNLELSWAKLKVGNYTFQFTVYRSGQYAIRTILK